MNSVSESLLSAVDILVNQAISKLEYDKTIQAEIYDIVNFDTGEYKVKYTGNIISAFASDITNSYKIGDEVYVIIPEGDFSNKKLITGKVSEQSLSYGEMVSLANSIIETSPTFDTMYFYQKSDDYGVVAGAPLSSPLSRAVIYSDSGDSYHGLFQQYSSNNSLIRIKGSFMTSFHCEHVKGNYGIEIVFYTKDETEVSYKLDLSSFNGAPYSLSTYSPQSVVVQFQPGFLTGIKSIQLFEEDFEYDRYVQAGEVTDVQNTTIANIFVKDVEIQFVTRENLTDTLYYLDISTPQGNSFTSTIPSLDLVARLIYDGDNILSSSNCTCQWYKRDLSVTVGSTYYEKQVGVGWSPVSTSVFATMTLAKADVPYQQDYKVLVVYKDNVVMTAETTIYNLESIYDLGLRQATIGDDIVLEIVNNKGSTAFVGDWYLSYPDGSYSHIASKQNSLVVTDYLNYSSVTFYCGVYNEAKTSIIRNFEHTIMSSESEEDITITYTGEDTFRYDANGDVTVEDAERERTLQVSLQWKDGIGTSYNVEWIAPDGSILVKSTAGATKHTAAESMIENLWVDNSNIFHYTIKQKYKVNYNNNTIKIKITTNDKKEYIFTKEILFLKDGDQGTNGTTYIIAIRPCDDDGNKISGLYPLVYRNSAWQNTLKLRCYVYKDGELINNVSGYTLTYKWTGVNISSNLNSDITEYVSFTGLDTIITAAAPPYVKVQVTINDKMNGRTYDVYAYYPIDVSYGFEDSELDLLSIEDIPSYIKYTSSGVSPSFYSNNIDFSYNGVTYAYNISSLDKTILDVVDEKGLYYLKPASSFIFENNTMAMLKCKYMDTKYLYHPIIMYLDTYGNEAINGWDGTTLQTDEESYIFAPQIGAGGKDSANRFTGVVMGKDSGQNLIGLYGYQAGTNTFGLMENGKAYFGAKSGGGQITIDGTKATILGGGDGTKIGGEASNGMTITLANLNPNITTTEAIKVAGGVFKVLYDGSLTATKATITGDITANTGYLGGKNGWVITTYRLYSGTSKGHVELNSDPSVDGAIWAGATSYDTAMGSKFAVAKDGTLYAKIGYIGGWKIGSTALVSIQSNYPAAVGMAFSGSAAFWAGSTLTTETVPTKDQAKFYVSRSGELSCKSATIEGAITATTLTTDNATIGGGYIGGWTISKTSLSAGSTYLNSSGQIICYNATIQGTITADTLSCDNGEIGGWTITSSGLYSSSNKIQLLSSGQLNVNNRFIVYSDGDLYTIGGIQACSLEIMANHGNNMYVITGILGSIEGNNGVTTTTDNIGIQTTNSNASIIFESKKNIKLAGSNTETSTSVSTIYLQDANLWIDTPQINLYEGASGWYLHCSVPKDNQTGIYARFG